MKSLSVMILSVVLSGCCCVSGTVESRVKRNVERCDNFVQKMDSGLTSRQQEQEFVRANRRMHHSLNFSINDVPLPADVEAELEVETTNE